MCWVMPPASPATTLVWRMASSSEVLPWSTWPMMVTTGARGSRFSSASVWPMKPSSTSASDTRLGVWPNSRTISSAVSASITSLILCIAPCFISSLMTSTERSVMRLASSWMVITSGMITSRMTLSRGCTTPAWRSFSRSRWRLQRGERALALRLVEGVVDGELDALAPLVAGLDRALGRLGALLLGARRPPRPRARPRAARPRAWRPARRGAAASPALAFSGGRGLASTGSGAARRLRRRRPRPWLRQRRLLDDRRRRLLRLAAWRRSASRRARSRCLGLGTLPLGLQRAAARVELVGRQSAGLAA